MQLLPSFTAVCVLFTHFHVRYVFCLANRDKDTVLEDFPARDYDVEALADRDDLDVAYEGDVSNTKLMGAAAKESTESTPMTKKLPPLTAFSAFSAIGVPNFEGGGGGGGSPTVNETRCEAVACRNESTWRGNRKQMSIGSRDPLPPTAANTSLDSSTDRDYGTEWRGGGIDYSFNFGFPVDDLYENGANDENGGNDYGLNGVDVQSTSTAVDTTGNAANPAESSTLRHAETTTTPTVSATRVSEPYQETTRGVWVYCSPVLIIIGTIGNFMSVVVMLRKKIRHTTTSLYLIVLAVVDTVVLYTGLVRYWIRELNGTDVRLYSNFGCKLHIFLVYAIQQFDSWVLVSVTMERVVAVFFPHKAKEVFTKQSASTGLLIIALIIISFNVQFFFTHELVNYTGTSQKVCTSIYKTHRDHLTYVWPWMDFCLFSLGPFILILVGNLAIVGRLLHSRYIRRRHLQVTTDNVKMTSMTAILLSVSLTFFLTTSPISIYLIGQSHWMSAGAGAMARARLRLAWAVVNMISYTNNAINFLLYCISGPRFRKELVAMFKRKNRVGATPHTVNSVSFELR